MTENNTLLIQTKSYLNNVFNILRADVNANEYHFVLFLLSLQKEGILDGVLNVERNSILSGISFNIGESKSKNALIHNKIWDLIQPTLERLNENTLRELLNLLRNLNQSILQENFSEIFDDLLYSLTKSQGRYGGDFILPQELSLFLSNLVELPNNAKVYNPFAGLASFGVFANENHKYLGQELNYTTWALGQLRLIAYNREVNSEFLQGDSIENWNPKKIYRHTKLEDFFKFPAENEKYDLIIANPPINLRPTHPINRRFGSIRNCEQFVIEKGIEDLAHNGKLIVIISNGFLFRGGSEQELRRYLIENDLLEMVITFPDGLLFNTGIPISVLVISRDKKDKGVVKFIDAKSTIENTSFREKHLNVEALDKIVKEDVVSEYVRIIPNEAIAKLDYNLNVPRYFQKDVEGVQLNQFVTSIRPQRNFEELHGKFLRIRDLKDDKLEYLLDLNSIEKVELPRNVQKISESCLLIAVRWRTLKPTFFEFSGESIFITPDTIALKVDESQVDVAYLINELHADYTTEQIDSYRLGSTIPTIRRDDLLNTKIVLPNIDVQRGKVAGLIEQSETIKALKVQNSLIDYGHRAKNFGEFASIKHTLGRPRENILDWSENLLHFINANNEEFDLLNKKFSEFYDIDIISALQEIKNDVNFITDVLEKGVNGFVLNEFEKHILSLSEINSIISDLSNNGFNFKIKKLLLKGEKLRQRGINANKTLFKTLLDNLLTNANKHAFDNKVAGNEVVIELTEVDNLLDVEIKNNGKPFPKNFDKEKFIDKYSRADSSKGSGLGGYDIHRIATDFNNQDWVLSLNEDLFYPVKFKFQFPIQLID